MRVRMLTISSLPEQNKKDVPFIRISGKWLEELEFKVGKKFIVEEKKGCLVLKVITIEE